MYLPITFAQRQPPGLSFFAPVSAADELAEFYPAPYDTLNPQGGGLGFTAPETDFITADSVIVGVPNWAIGLGLLGALSFLLVRKGRGSARHKARQRYEEELGRINKDYTIAGRARKAARKIPRVRLSRA